MALRFFRRVKLAPGLSLNLSKRGGSLSVGPRGAKYTAGTSGQRRTFGLPGTGLWYTERVGHDHRSGAKPARASSGTTPSASGTRAADKLDLGFFKRLFTPEEEKHFIDGMKQVLAGRNKAAIATLDCPHALADALFMAGMLALKAGRNHDAIGFFTRARDKGAELGASFDKYGLSAQVHLPVTGRINVIIEPGHRGLALALAKAEEGNGNGQRAIDILQDLHRHATTDEVVILALAELLVDEQHDHAAWRKVVKLSAEIDNHSAVTAAILYWKGRALRELDLLDAARDTLTAAFRRKKDREPELLHAIQYERALVYAALGEKRRAREEFGRIYAADPDYEDVARRIDRTPGTAE